MIDELELLRRHIDGTVDPNRDLEPIRRRLMASIEQEGGGSSPSPGHIENGHRKRFARRTSISVGGLVAVGVAAAVVVLLVGDPAPAHHRAPRTATEPFPSHL